MKILCGDSLEVLKTLESESVNCCVTSPPYFGLRDYGMEGQIGLEETPEEFVGKLVAVFREVRRVLRSDGTLWLNLGDSYSGSGKGQTREGSQDPKRGKTNGMKGYEELERRARSIVRRSDAIAVCMVLLDGYNG